jgi:hypothetical protein
MFMAPGPGPPRPVVFESRTRRTRPGSLVPPRIIVVIIMIESSPPSHSDRTTGCIITGHAIGRQPECRGPGSHGRR